MMPLWLAMFGWLYFRERLPRIVVVGVVIGLVGVALLVWPVGAGAKSDVVADLITFSRSKGLYGGLNLDGTVVSVNDDWNKAYYGKPVLPPDILVTGSVTNKGASKLLSDVAKAAGGK